MLIQDDLFMRWQTLQMKLAGQFGKKPDVDAVLFLIGLQETGFKNKKITKEQKQDMMHVAICTILSDSGFYAFDKYDADGWPHFKQLKELPVLSLIEQENFLKDHILLYFEKQNF